MDDPTPTPVEQWQDSRAVRVLVRVARTWLQGFLAFGAGGTITGWDQGPAAVLPIIAWSAWIALGPAFVALLMNAIEELNHIDPGTTQRG